MTDVQSFEKRVSLAEQKIQELTQKINQLQRTANERNATLEAENKKLKADLDLSRKSAGAAPARNTFISASVNDRIPVGHTLFSWGAQPLSDSVGQEAAQSASAQSSRAQNLYNDHLQTTSGDQFHGLESIKSVLEKADVGASVVIAGWAKTVRVQGGGTFAFVELNDGSCFGSLQIIVDANKPGFEGINGPLGRTGASLLVKGRVVPSPGKEQAVELQADEVALIGGCEANSYPLAKKQHSLEFLRSIAHLRPRTNTFGAVARVRSALAYAVHRFFQENGFFYVHTPIITASDCEGAGELFGVTTLLSSSSKQKDVPSTPSGDLDYTRDFFGRSAYLTVSGQLSVENYACALGRCYTFGPTFRAEVSNTKKHLSEFWMIEPELAFAGLSENISLAEAFLKYLITYVLDTCSADLAFFEKQYEANLITRLKRVVDSKFLRVSYTQAVEDLIKCGHTFEITPQWGLDLGTEHERYLTENIYKQPVVVYDYPKDIKAFYMKSNADGKTVAAMDVLVPKIGEIIGGSQREENLEVLSQKIKEKGLNVEDYKWYLDLRRFGTVPHSGFGLGFERMVMFVTGMENIRDVIPYPRYPGHAEF